MNNIMVQGTTSSSGKSLLATGLCRIFTEDGYKVKPFKSQNMAGNSFTTKDGKLISPAQALQAIACNQEPNENMNPILMLPTSFTESNIIIKGEKYKNTTARDYFENRGELKELVLESYEYNSKDMDIVVLEGAGSPAEINLQENDFVNMGLANMVDSPVVLVGNIDRGGIFASFYGTVKLLKKHEQERIKGLIINNFLGDISLLETGIKMIEDILNIPVIGVIPYLEIESLKDENVEESKNNSKMKEDIENDIKYISKEFRKHLNMDLIYKIVGR